MKALVLSVLLLGAPLALASPPELDHEVALRVELEALRAELEQQIVRHDEELVTLRERLQRLDEAARPVDGDRVGYGEPVRVGPDERVQEVVAFGGDVHVEGEVAGDATAFGGSVHVADGARVRGDAIAFGGEVRLADGATVDGNQIVFAVPGASTSSEDAEPRVVAAGSVGELAGPGLFATLYRRLVVLLSVAGAGVLVVGLFPRRVGRVAVALEQAPLRAAAVGLLGTGFLALFSLLFAIVTLGLGLPVSLVVWAALGLAWLLGFVGLCQAVGDRLPLDQKVHGRWLALLAGAMLVAFAGSLPFVGWLVVVGASVVGVGAALTTRFGGR